MNRTALSRFSIASLWFCAADNVNHISARTKSRGTPYRESGDARNSLGFIPLHRLNACVKELISRYPRSHAISEIGNSLSLRYRLARAARSSSSILPKVKPSAESERDSVRELRPSWRATSDVLALPCG